MLTENEVKKRMNQIYNGGPGSGNPNPGQGRGKGKPAGGGGKLSSETMGVKSGYYTEEKLAGKMGELITADYESSDYSYQDPVYATTDELSEILASKGEKPDALSDGLTVDAYENLLGYDLAHKYMREAEYTLAADEARIQAENHNDQVSGVWSKNPKDFADDFHLDYDRASNWAMAMASDWTGNGDYDSPEDYDIDFNHNYDIALWAGLYHECKEECLATGDWKYSEIMDITEKEWD